MIGPLTHLGAVKRPVDEKAREFNPLPAFGSREHSAVSDSGIVTMKRGAVPLKAHADLLFGAGAPVDRPYEMTTHSGPEEGRELARWAQKIFDVAKSEGLDPFPVRWINMGRDDLISTTARVGFPVRYRHWSFGQAYQDLLLPQKHGHSNLYELVINTNPSYAYMLRENPMYAQKVVMAHVYGHTDFFKNNIAFRHTNRNMMERIANNASTIKHILDTEENVNFLDMERTIEQAMSLQWLIDMAADQPRPLKYKSKQREKVEDVDVDYGKVDDSGYAPHIRRRMNDPERLTRERAEEQQRLDALSRQNPKEPDADVLGFIIENSTVLEPWQRDVLAVIRDESYYFVPQMKTKIMNEGWASYWHEKLMTTNPELVDHEHATEIAKMMGGVVAGNPYQLNPYQLGIAMFRNIEERWDKGRHGPDYERITDLEERKKFDTEDGKGREKIFEVRKEHTDFSFINEFFNEDIATEIKMYTWDPSIPDWRTRRQQIKISSREAAKTKKRLLEMLENGGQPLIKVINGNYNNRGELQLSHVHRYNLDWDDAENTMKNLFALWGNKVHLDTYQDIDFLNQLPPFYIEILNDPDYVGGLPDQSLEELEKILDEKIKIKLRMTARENPKKKGDVIIEYTHLDDDGKELGDIGDINSLTDQKLREINRKLEAWQRRWLW